MKHTYSDSHALSYRDGSGDWRDAAACRDVDPELFYPLSDGLDGQCGQQIRQAQRICEGCPVRRECFKDAWETGDEWGIRAGTTGRQRRAWRRRREQKVVAA